MPTTLNISTKKPEKDVKLLLRSLPGVLTGRRVDDQHGLRPIFYGVLAQELYKRISEAYARKSEGFPDDLGNSWEPLSPKTIRNRQLPKVVSKYPLSLRLLILRVSDSLFASLSPGEFDGSTYHPTDNQIFRYGLNKLQLGSHCDHASYVHKKRPLWPDDISPWVEASLEIAIQAVMQRIKEVLQ